MYTAEGVVEEILSHTTSRFRFNIKIAESINLIGRGYRSKRIAKIMGVRWAKRLGRRVRWI
jgi:hypothetical protein